MIRFPWKRQIAWSKLLPDKLWEKSQGLWVFAPMLTKVINFDQVIGFLTLGRIRGEGSRLWMPILPQVCNLLLFHFVNVNLNNHLIYD